jgi:hypothetical protein
MQESTHIGLDVHKDSIAVAVLRPGSSECDERVIPNTPEALRKLASIFHEGSRDRSESGFAPRRRSTCA